MFCGKFPESSPSLLLRRCWARGLPALQTQRRRSPPQESTRYAQARSRTPMPRAAPDSSERGIYSASPPDGPAPPHPLTRASVREVKWNKFRAPFCWRRVSPPDYPAGRFTPCAPSLLGVRTSGGQRTGPPTLVRPPLRGRWMFDVRCSSAENSSRLGRKLPDPAPGNPLGKV